MRVSDFVFKYLKAHGTDTVYMLSGGGIMYLVDSLGRSGIRYVCCHHEQAASIAAQAHGMYDDNLGVCLVTTGPGGTNAITGCAAAYMDSTPVLYLSGQVKTSDFASIRGVRQFGAQENDIISMVRPVTKYAALVMNPEDILYEMEKSLFHAQTGRKGPVWLDIPLDVQSAEIDEASLRHFFSEIETQSEDNKAGLAAAVNHTIDLIRTSKRPVILVGHGVISSGAQESVRRLAERTSIPVLATWRALSFMASDEQGFYGSPGLQAPRYSNLILQHADALIVLGSRLDNMITAFNEEHFAFRAKKVIVDIVENEIRKLNMSDVFPVVADIKLFADILNHEIDSMDLKTEYGDWIRSCDAVKQKYPISNEKQDFKDGVDLYKVTATISQYAEKNDVIVISSTSRCNTAGHIAFTHKREQRTISSMGLGSMGFALPSVVGAYYASGGSRVVMIEGDGSLQLNLQELQTIKSYGINAKMFIFSNKGYAAITTMQERNFDGFYVGSNEQSGVFMPDMEKISRAYDIPYLRISTDDEIDEIIQCAMNTDVAIICEICGGLHFDEIPKCISSINKTSGKRESALLENPYPFLCNEEMADNALVFKVKI